MNDGDRDRVLLTLDGWRGIAIIAVLCCHSRWTDPHVARAAVNGSWGVQLFFALSGFLITSRLLDEQDRFGRISWSNFYVRRMFRILPAALFFLLVLAMLGPGLNIVPVDVSELVSSALFFRNYALWKGPGWYTLHFWSLAVEWHFYLLWPIILAVAGVARGLRAAVFFAVLTIAFRTIDGHLNWEARLVPSLLINNYPRTDYVICEMFWGCALAFAWHRRAFREALKKYVRGSWVVVAICLIVALLYFRTKFYNGFVEMLIATLPLLTVAHPYGIVARILENRVLKHVGLLSYSLYLWQQLFIPASEVPRVWGILQSFPLNIALAFAAASFSYYFVERPDDKFWQESRVIARPEARIASVACLPRSQGNR